MNERAFYLLGVLAGFFIMYLLHTIIYFLNEMIEEHKEKQFLKWLKANKKEDVYYNLEKQKLDYLLWKEER